MACPDCLWSRYEGRRKREWSDMRPALLCGSLPQFQGSLSASPTIGEYALRDVRNRAYAKSGREDLNFRPHGPESKVQMFASYHQHTSSLTRCRACVKGSRRTRGEVEDYWGPFRTR